MSVNTRAVGLLNDLQKLGDAGRDRVLSVLSQDDMKALVKVALCERDKVQGLVVPPTLPPVDVPDGPMHSFMPNYAIRAPNGESRVSTKSSKLVSILRYPKQPRAERAGAQDVQVFEEKTIEIERAKKSDGETTESASMPPAPPNGTHSLPKCPGKNGSPIPAMRGNPPRDLPMYLKIGAEKSIATYMDIEELPLRVQAELTRRWKNMWSQNESRAARYIACTTEPPEYATNTWCIRNMVVRDGYPAVAWYTLGGKHGQAADDMCVDAGSPCGCLFKIESTDKLVVCLVPLPKILRGDKAWNELGYWVV